MKAVAKFEKVSKKQFLLDTLKIFSASEEEIKGVMNCLAGEEASEAHKKLYNYILEAYNSIELPKRSTSGSAGYDFIFPLRTMKIGECPVLIPTGIRCKINDGYVLSLFPRSGHGFKYGFKLRNTVGIIDSDYYNSDNEGHIMAKVETAKQFELEHGKAFMQGILTEYFITVDDEANGIRNGGFGSTDQ